MDTKKTYLFIIGLLFAATSYAQETKEHAELIPFGDMDQWMVRTVDESFIIGGQTKYLYEIATGDTLRDNTPYKNTLSPWATSSVMAKVSGIYKGSVTVFPEKRGDGYCTRLETRLEEVKVFGVINLTVLATGTVFLGELMEPVRDTKNPQGKLNHRITFERKPVALEFDYKVSPGGEQVKATGLGKPKAMGVQNNAEACLYLQYRWEDEDGNVFAQRVGTAYERYDKEVSEWQNGHRIDIHYGDITQEDFFEPYMGLVEGEQTQYCQNSRGEMTPIREVGWAAPGTMPTHIVLRFSSGHGGAYIGTPNAKFWIDNVKLIYED